MSSSSKYELLLHEAISNPLGIKVDVEGGDRELARQKFYQARARDILLFEHISVVIDPINPARLWLLNKGGTSAED